jgi:hypothetical protein
LDEKRQSFLGEWYRKLQTHRIAIANNGAHLGELDPHPAAPQLCHRGEHHLQPGRHCHARVEERAHLRPF